jgi:predicted HTH transcriptional regulator
MERDIGGVRKLEASVSNTSSLTNLAENGSEKWWETSEGHRFAGEVLQLRIRREIMKFIGPEARTRQDIETAFGLKENLAELHLALLEKADMVEKIDGFYRSTTIGSAYIKNFEAFISP